MILFSYRDLCSEVLTSGREREMRERERNDLWACLFCQLGGSWQVYHTISSELLHCLKTVFFSGENWADWKNPKNGMGIM